MTATTYARRLDGRHDRPDPGRPRRAPPRRRASTLIDVVAENDDALIEKYLEGEEITTEELIGGDPDRRGRGARSSRSCAPAGAAASASTACSTCSSRRSRRPRPWARGRRSTPSRASRPRSRCARTARPWPTASRPLADQFSGRINLLRVFSGVAARATATSPARAAAPRSGWDSSSRSRARSTCRSSEIGPGDIGAVAKLKEVATGDVLVTGEPARRLRRRSPSRRRS